MLDFAAGLRTGIRPFGKAFAHLAAVAGICSVLMLLGLGLVLASGHLPGLMSVAASMIGETALVTACVVLLGGTVLVWGAMFRALAKEQP